MPLPRGDLTKNSAILHVLGLLLTNLFYIVNSRKRECFHKSSTKKWLWRGNLTLFVVMSRVFLQVKRDSKAEWGTNLMVDIGQIPILIYNLDPLLLLLHVQCSRECGYGTQQRMVVCQMFDGSTGAPHMCGGYTPLSLRDCVEKPCGKAVWNVTEWSQVT